MTMAMDIGSRTQILKDAVAMFTDLRGFTRYSVTAPIEDVERILEFWDESHKAVVSVHNGVIRAVMGDTYFLSFESADDAVAAWLDLQEGAAEFVAPGIDKIRFSAGLDVGELRVFRNTTFGETTNNAARFETRSREAGSNRLCMPLAVAEGLKEDLAAQINVSPLGDGVVALRRKH